MTEKEMTNEEVREMLRAVEEENLRAIFDKNRKIETDDDLLELAKLVDDEAEGDDI